MILVREETNPEDVEGMRAAEGILTARGGMTSHAALVARGWGKCCIVGAGDMKIDLGAKRLSVGEVKLKEGDLITLNGTKGKVYAGALEMMDATENPRFQGFMKLVDKFRTLGVRTNADTPQDAKVAREFGAEGIGLFRTEHMFYGAGSDQPLVPAAEDDPQQDGRRAQGRAGRAVPLRQERASRPRWKRWTACRSPSGCWIRRCTSSCRRTRPSRRNWPRRWAFAPSRSRNAARPCTKPTP